jgi:polyene glycosyltransferase
VTVFAHVHLTERMSLMSAPAGPVLFSCISRTGQLNPILAIAAELSRHAVPDLWFASYVDSRSKIEAASTRTQINFVSLDPRNPTGIKWGESDLEMMQCSGPMSTDGIMALLKKTINSPPEWRISAYRNMLDVIDRIQPSLMVIDTLNPSSMDAAMTRDVPFIVTVPALPSCALRLPWDYPSPITNLPRKMNFSQYFSNIFFKFRLRAAILAHTPVISFTKKCKSIGIKNPSANPYVYTDAAAMVLTSSVFGLEYEFPLSPRVRLIGAFLPPEPDNHRIEDPDLSRWLDDNTSVVYLGFGTLMRLPPAQMAALLVAVRRLGPEHKFLWKLSKSQQELLPPTSLPDNLRVESWIPSQLGVLAHPHVRAFVTHGGANGFHESIYYGKPVLVMPAWLDCYAIARRAIDSGVGLAIDHPATVTSDEVATKITRILTEDSFRQRAEYWAQRLREAGGVARAADLILELKAELS